MARAAKSSDLLSMVWSLPPAQRLMFHAGVRVDEVDTAGTPGFEGGREDGERFIDISSSEIARFQKLLYANGVKGVRRRLLIVLQGMDASGKGGIVRHVFRQGDPMGIHYHGFGKPTEEELAHDFLWRVKRELPQPGWIAVFDRSHYEDVVMPHVYGTYPEDVWRARYDEINRFERELVTDTLVNAYNPADTVATILRTIQTQVSDSILHVQGNVQEKINSFKRTGWDLSLRMNQILQAFEQEEQALINQRLQLEQNVRSKSVHTIAIVAIMAIILVVVFLFFIERDILRSNHYRQELEKSKRRAEGLLMAREKLMLTITHDIKAPVGSILGYIDLLTRLLKEERQRFYLQNMKSSARHLLDLVSSLLDYHKLESHKMEVNQIPFNPYELFQTIYTSFEPLANKKNLQLRFEGDERLNRFYMGDPFRIRQVADNLLSNALKFTRQGSITLHIELRDARFHFSVTDTGSGISMEEQKHMFEEFTRLQNAQGQEGFGLGLAITQRLIVLMNGDIRVDSHPGQGSRFTVSLPLHLAAGDTSPKAAEEKVPAATVRPKVPLPDGQQIRLLFIDDDRIQLDLTKAMLHHPQLEVHCCESPDVLFQQLEKNTYDLLFTDIQMPGLNGFELLKELRRLPCEQARRIPVIALTARSEIDEQQFIAEGFSGCLHKPYSKKEVIRLIEQQTGWTLAAISLPTPSATTLLRTDDGSFNFAALTAFSEDDAEASDEIIRSFIEETRQNKARLEEAVKAGDCQAIRSIAHKLLPLFTMIEAKECVPILKELEREPYEEVTASVAQKINIVLLQMEKIIKEAQHRH